ncbi:clostripain-related cysteine peptidase [Deferrisoma camini]|uniref:clostripain-related cysteine peptidase n=1 Tax=Deferrisoma camini TaxID=1035120 RepID=UPI00146F1AAF|nr:clostripain-related cysteine peptidase [Deferrisoma camini]
MRKGVAIGLVFLLAALFGCGGGGGGGGGPTQQTENIQNQPPTGKTATVLVYMIGSDLESQGNAGSTDIEEMKRGVSGDRVNWIITTGGANKDGWRTVARWRITAARQERLADLGARNMGEAQTLEDFLVWGVRTYPADSYHVILWDHGAGRRGFGLDEVFGGDTLTLEELQAAFSAAKGETGVVFETIGFDACSMATLEVALTLQDFGRYLIASENTEPGQGWDHEAVAAAVSARPEMNGVDFGKAVADAYKRHIEQSSPLEAKTTTLSVIDLSKISDVKTALDDLMSGLVADFQQNPVQVVPVLMDTATKSTKFPAGFQKASIETTDLIHSMNLLEEEYSLAAEVAEAARSAVVYSIKGDWVPNANGLAFYDLWDGATYVSTDFAFAYAWSVVQSFYYELATMYWEYVTQDVTPPVFVDVSFGDSGDITAEVYDPNLREVYAVITAYDESTGGEWLVGSLPVDSLTVQGGTGYVETVIDTVWVTLGGDVVPVFAEREDENHWWLSTPALLSGEEVEILSRLDRTTGEITTIGAYPTAGEDEPLARETIELKPGDLITPIWTEIPSWEEYVGDDFEVTTGPLFEFGELPDGYYYVYLYAEDASGNWQFSQGELYEVYTPAAGRAAKGGRAALLTRAAGEPHPMPEAAKAVLCEKLRGTACDPR